jgi:hypothetical protein
VLRTQWQGQDGDGVRVVTNRGDVLEVTVPSLDEEMLAQLGEAAHILAYVIDLYHSGPRTTTMSLAPEIQHQLLPTACYEAAQFTVAGALVPAHDIGGDTYDYALDRNVLHLSMTDAVGHDVASAHTALSGVAARDCHQHPFHMTYRLGKRDRECWTCAGTTGHGTARLPRGDDPSSAAAARDDMMTSRTSTRVDLGGHIEVYQPRGVGGTPRGLSRWVGDRCCVVGLRGAGLRGR